MLQIIELAYQVYFSSSPPDKSGQSSLSVILNAPIPELVKASILPIRINSVQYILSFTRTYQVCESEVQKVFEPMVMGLDLNWNRKYKVDFSR
ncbi:MAG: hypothetical protein QM669_04720 [Siphonobacter sp.]